MPRQTSKKPAARARQRTAAPSISGEPRDELDESESDADLVDEALLSFVSTPALGADHLLVMALSPAGDVTLQNRQAREAERTPEALTLSIAASCERHAAAEKRAVRFRAAWMRNDKTLATYTWECGSGKAERELDGSVQSFLVDQQSNARELHKLQIESWEMVKDSWKEIHTMQQKRIESLERENAELRNRLRKLDDVQTEIAIEQMRVDLEQRGRTTDLLEKRVLPIAQALMLRQLNGTTAPTAIEPSENKQSDNKQSST